MNKKCNIGIAKRDSRSKWNQKFCEALDKKLDEGYEFSYETIDLDGDDWLKKIKPFDIIIWKSPWMGRLSFHYKEKIFFIKNHLGKEVIPNFDTVWHFDSKIAQHFIFEKYNIKTPKTFVSFNYSEAEKYILECTYPQILKLSAGSSSKNVKLIKNQAQAKKTIKKHFRKSIFWRKRGAYCDHQMFNSIYLQEFVHNNDSDLRITVIGDKYAFGFWRENRDNDFRASGSGKIDYQRKIPEELLNYCTAVSKKLNFDSMAYDVLFNGKDFFITEISYGYSQKAIYDAPGYYQKKDDNNFVFRKGHYWPQDLWIEWLFEKNKIKKS